MKLILTWIVCCLGVMCMSSIATEDSTTVDNLIGKYSCTFTQDGYSYNPFTCVISSQDGHIQLEKISGSQRIKGEVTLTEEGFDFEGSYFCPFGDCTSPTKGQFKKLSAAVYEGTVHTENGSDTIVKLTKMTKK